MVKLMSFIAPCALYLGASAMAAGRPPDMEGAPATEKKLCLCAFELSGTSKAGNIGGFIGGAVGGAVGGASNAGSYYQELSGEMQQIFEAGLARSTFFQYINRKELVAPTDGKNLAGTINGNRLYGCLRAKSFCAAKAGFAKRVVLATHWELVGAGGRKLKIDTSAVSSDTYGKFPNGADPKLKPVFLELARQSVNQFIEKLRAKTGWPQQAGSDRADR